MSQPEPTPTAELPAEPPPRAFEVGGRIGRVMIRKFVAAGGMGELYRGWDTALGRPVAIKTLLASTAAHDPLYLARFREEAKAVANVRSDNVIQVLEYGEIEGGRPYIVMPFLEGKDLSQRLRTARQEGKPLAIHEAIEIILGACRGVHACHCARIIHRDLKPGNIFLTKDQDRGRLLVVVLDFGVSQPRQRENAEATYRGLVIGTPAYMPREQALGMDVSFRSDEYALAALLYQCVTLHGPYDYAEAGLTDPKERANALMRAIRSERRCPRPRSYAPNLPEGLEAALVRALSPDPDERYKDVYEFARAIVAFASDKVKGYYGDYLRDPPLPIVMPQLSIPISADGWPRLPSADVPRVWSPPSEVRPSSSDKRSALPPLIDPDGESLDALVRKALSPQTSPGTPINERSTAVMPPDADLLLLAQLDEDRGSLTEVSPPAPQMLGIPPDEDREPRTEVRPPDLDFLGISPAPVIPVEVIRSSGIPVLRGSDDRARAIIVRSTPWGVPPVPAPDLAPASDSVHMDLSDAGSNGTPRAVKVVPERGRIPTVAAIFAVTLVATLSGAFAFQRWRRPVTTMAEPPAFLSSAPVPRAAALPHSSPPETLPQPASPSPTVQSLATTPATASSPPFLFLPTADAPSTKSIEKKRRHVVHRPAAERYDANGILIPEADPLPRRPPWWKSWHLDQYGHKVATDRRGRMWRLDDDTGRPGMEVDDHGIPMLTK